MNKIALFICCITITGCVTQQDNSQYLTKLAKDPQPCRPKGSTLQQEASKGSVAHCISHQEQPTTEKNEPPSKKSSTTIYPQSVMKNMALEGCKGAIMATLYAPNTFDRDISNTTIRIIDKNRITLKIPFKAKTGFGDKVSQVAYCVTDNVGEILMLNIANK